MGSTVGKTPKQIKLTKHQLPPSNPRSSVIMPKSALVKRPQNQASSGKEKDSRVVL